MSHTVSLVSRLSPLYISRSLSLRLSVSRLDCLFDQNCPYIGPRFILFFLSLFSFFVSLFFSLDDEQLDEVFFFLFDGLFILELLRLFHEHYRSHTIAYMDLPSYQVETHRHTHIFTEHYGSPFTFFLNLFAFLPFLPFFQDSLKPASVLLMFHEHHVEDGERSELWKLERGLIGKGERKEERGLGYGSRLGYSDVVGWR